MRHRILTFPTLHHLQDSEAVVSKAVRLDNPDGIAEITCNVDCGNGDTYSLSYTATTGDEPNGFGNLTYELYLTGTVSSVPIPAAAWLFCSGLLGLIGMARCKKVA